MNSSDENRHNRDSSDDNVNSHVQKLFKEKEMTTTKLNSMLDKYDNQSLRDKIKDEYIQRSNMIRKKAKKFAQLIREKYSDTHTPLHVILDKARYFKDKYSLTEDEFGEFQRIYELDLIGLKSVEILTHTTNLSKILGNPLTEISTSKPNVKLSDTDYKKLQEIYKLQSVNKSLHAQIFLQSIRYQDCSLEALSGEYKKSLGHRATDHVHPVIVALFLPKIDNIDSYFLHSNLSEIVYKRFNGQKLNTISNYQLYHGLITDPNDIACDSRSPMDDLLQRVQLQLQLWNCVLNLRNGQYFNESFRQFISTIDTCKINQYDTPDLVYGRHDGTVLKRVLAAFSYRPTYVTTRPVLGISVSTNPYLQNSVPIIRNIPMVNLSLPQYTESSVQLTDAIQQSQLVIENNQFVTRQTNIVYSRDVLFFFVDRRSVYMSFKDLKPFNLESLPIAMAGFEKLNDTSVIAPEELEIRDDKFVLRSIVTAVINDKISSTQKIIVGSATIIKILQNNTLDDSIKHIIYDPLNVSDFGSIKGVDSSSPIQYIDESDNEQLIALHEIIEKNGIIYMYQLMK